MLNKLRSSASETFHGTRRVIRRGLGTLKRDPQIAAYPYMAAIFIAVSLPLVNGLFFGLWSSFWQSSIFNVVDDAPRQVRILLGIGSLSFFYTAFVTAIFTCAVSASVLAKLEGQKTAPLYGLRRVLRRFLKVAGFSLISIFFFPLAVIAQYKKLPKGIFGVLISAFGLHMPQLAPVIINENRGLLGSIQSSVETLSRTRGEGITIRILMILALPLLGLAAILANYVIHKLLNGDVADYAGWLVAIFIGATGYITIKVIGTVFTTSLYYHAKQKQ